MPVQSKQGHSPRSARIAEPDQFVAPCSPAAPWSAATTVFAGAVATVVLTEFSIRRW